MTEQKPKMNMLLIVLAALIIFAGPTYGVYVLFNMLDLNYFVAMGAGFALFIVGLAFLLLLMKKKIIS
jgi:hypothetical protein